MKFNLRLLYLYLFSFVGLLVVIFGSVRLVNLGFKTFVFPDVDRYEMVPTKVEDDTVDPTELKALQDRELVRNRQRELSESLAMVVVGLPVYLYHWKTIQKEGKK